MTGATGAISAGRRLVYKDNGTRELIGEVRRVGRLWWGYDERSFCVTGSRPAMREAVAAVVAWAVTS